MKKVTLLLLGVSLCSGIPQQRAGSLEELINGVFTEAPPIAASNQDSGSNSAFATNTPNKSNVFLGSQNVPAARTDCECVPYYQCKNGKILEDGVDLIDIRVSGGECEHYLDVCCKPPDRRDPTDPVTPKPTPRPNQGTGCGFRNSNGVGFRITGHTDNEAQFAEFPWMVAILSERPNANGSNSQFFECGGSLIHTRAVLTAAHCVNGKLPSQITIRAGEWDTQTRNEPLPHQDRKVQSIIVHENFHSSALRNDFAILILEQPVDIASNVDIVCLAESEQVFDGSRCFVSGWGKSSFGKEGRYSVILKRVDVPAVPHDTCQSALRKTRLGKYFSLDSSFMCAGGEIGKDTCQGDGGGPLVCPVQNDPTRYVQAGIVAWGIGCGQETPAVYANVAKARKWIDNQMTNSNLGVNTYRYSSQV